MKRQASSSGEQANELTPEQTWDPEARRVRQ
jgi:hypothetical protein